LNSLTEEQRTAIIACKTEEDFDRAVDEYDFDLPDEMLKLVFIRRYITGRFDKKGCS
jgi:hypothetical protein